ncbi:hypothetical protein EI546_03610 [Aequorivita sp. H23M31]|uniref:Uncharacterized protein n=1 Tax=Aequorivita ciconiae TaxID=2494375 RepID=A0A410G0W9_9FLAO|nr:hypothetical protein [Aequorivita sp. H23M31]QAA80870.1 hypothetical protein EI546_03610 [Aequorivita sp. H23M31]
MIIILVIIIVILIVVIIYLYVHNRGLQLVLQKARKDIGNETSEILTRKSESRYDHSARKKVGKWQAMEIVNSFLGKIELNNSNTNYSSINTTVPVWWFDINRTRFLDDLHLILAKDHGFVWLKIPKGTIEDPSRIFYIRPDNGLVQLKISSVDGSDYLRDVSSGIGDFRFSKYVEMEF